MGRAVGYLILGVATACLSACGSSAPRRAVAPGTASDAIFCSAFQRGVELSAKIAFANGVAPSLAAQYTDALTSMLTTSDKATDQLLRVNGRALAQATLATPAQPLNRGSKEFVALKQECSAAGHAIAG
jgi:hypothetical protein